MPQYAYKCFKPGCTETGLMFARYGETAQAPVCLEHGVMQRDYKAERVAVDAAVNSIKMDRETDAKASLFLPTRKDFEKTSRSEKEVETKIKDWNERHENPTKGSGKYRPR